MKRLSSFRSVKRNSDGKRPNPVPTHNIILIVSDKSGSMDIMGNKPFEGVTKILNEQLNLYKKNQIDTEIRLVLFNEKQHNIIGDDKKFGLSIHEIKFPESGDFTCGGTTCLYDTVITNLDIAFKTRNDYLNKLPKKVRILNPNVQITFILITDGIDNRSQKYSRTDMQNTIEYGRKHHNMTAFYLATDGLAAEMASKYGFSKKRSLSFTPSKQHCKSAFDGLTQLVRSASIGQSKDKIEFPELVRTSSSDAYNNTIKKQTQVFLDLPLPTLIKQSSSIALPSTPLKLKRQKNIFIDRKKLLKNNSIDISDYCVI